MTDSPDFTMRPALECALCGDRDGVQAAQFSVGPSESSICLEARIYACPQHLAEDHWIHEAIARLTQALYAHD